MSVHKTHFDRPTSTDKWPNLPGNNPQILVVVEANANATYTGGVESLDIQPPEGKEVGVVLQCSGR